MVGILEKVENKIVVKWSGFLDPDYVYTPMDIDIDESQLKIGDQVDFYIEASSLGRTAKLLTKTKKIGVPEDIRKHIGNAIYDPNGQIILRSSGEQFLDVRGWGSIQREYDTLKGAADFQDKLGQWVVDVINEKLNGKA